MSDISDTLRKIINEAKNLEAEENYQAAHILLSDAIKLNKDNTSFLPFLLNQRGIVSSGQGHFNEAFDDYINVLSMTFLSNDEIAHTYINIADIYRVRDFNFEKANESIKNALDYVVNGSFMQAKAADQKGMILYSQTFSKDLDDDLKKSLLNAAKLEYSKARDITKDLMEKEPDNIDVKKLFANTTHRIGLVSFLLNSNLKNEACSAQTKAYKMHEKINNYKGMSNALSTLGEIERKTGNANRAVMWYNKSLKYTKNIRGIVGTSLVIAEAYASLNNFEAADLYAGVFLNRAEDLPRHDLVLLKNIFQNLFDAYKHRSKDIEGLNKAYELIKKV